MAQFTDSPYEYQMKQTPKGTRMPGSCLPRYPPGHKCFHCPYGRDKPCIGLCLKDIAPEMKKKEKTMKQTQSKKGQTAAVLLAAFFFSISSLCIPAVAGGYSGNAPLRVDVVSIRDWPGETDAVMEIAENLDEHEDGEEATSSNAERATKSNARKSDAKKSAHTDTRTAKATENTPISIIHPSTPANAAKQEMFYADHE